MQMISSCILRSRLKYGEKTNSTESKSNGNYCVNIRKSKSSIDGLFVDLKLKKSFDLETRQCNSNLSSR